MEDLMKEKKVWHTDILGTRYLFVSKCLFYFLPAMQIREILSEWNWVVFNQLSCLVNKELTVHKLSCMLKRESCMDSAACWQSDRVVSMTRINGAFKCQHSIMLLARVWRISCIWEFVWKKEKFLCNFANLFIKINIFVYCICLNFVFQSFILLSELD